MGGRTKTKDGSKSDGKPLELDEMDKYLAKLPEEELIPWVKYFITLRNEDMPPIKQSLLTPPPSRVKFEEPSSPPLSSQPHSRRRSSTPCPNALASQSSELPAVPRRTRSSHLTARSGTPVEPPKCLGISDEKVFSNTVQPSKRYCKEHQGQQLQWNDNEFWLRGKSDSPELFDDWIPHYLTKKTQEKIQETMTRATDTEDRDRNGIIYAYQLSDLNKTEEVHIKVGRTTNLGTRLKAWKQQCGKDMKLLGYWPPKEEGAEYMGARYHYIIERLVLLELHDVALHSLHLLRGYPHNVKSGRRPQYMKKQQVRCDGKNCGRVHVEIFSFEQRGKEKNRAAFPPKEWEKVVWNIIDKWAKFAELYLEGRLLDEE